MQPDRGEVQGTKKGYNEWSPRGHREVAIRRKTSAVAVLVSSGGRLLVSGGSRQLSRREKTQTIKRQSSILSAIDDELLVGDRPRRGCGSRGGSGFTHSAPVLPS